MTTVKDVFAFLDAYAPVCMKMDFDNVGFLVGREQAPVRKILVSLDITEAVIEEAVAVGADMIVAHHPLFFSVKSVTDSDRTGRKIVRLLEKGIAAVCMHTNLDAAVDGVNDALAKAVGISEPELLTIDGYLEDGTPYCIGRCGTRNEAMSMSAFLPWLKSALSANGLRYHDAGRPVHRVAVVGGSGGDDIRHAVAKGCDTFITADVKYHQLLEAKELGINIIDADHFCTENVVVPVLQASLAHKFPEIEVLIAASHGQTAQFI